MTVQMLSIVGAVVAVAVGSISPALAEGREMCIRDRTTTCLLPSGWFRELTFGSTRRGVHGKHAEPAG